MFQLLSALTYCHEKKVIHRDLKPENILLLSQENNLTVKVADFGSSCIIHSESSIQGCFGSAYYIAPEVLTNNYDEKCDIWSLGIIMYILLTGKPPYAGKDTEIILRQVRNNPLVITPFKVIGLSNEAVSLLEMLLRLSPSQRIEAKQAVQHPWILKYRESSSDGMEILLNNLKEFNCESKLKEAVHVFLASQIVANEELKNIRKKFQQLDKNGDGKITKEELMIEYTKVMNLEDAKRTVDEIIFKLDQDLDGNIDYTEFLISCEEYQKTISIENLEVAFKMFDTDGSGTITVDEIKNTLQNGQMAEEDAWEMILKEADTNGDGCIDLKEFISLMRNMDKISRIKSNRPEN
jgi:calcium-dependent protein kinase